MSYLDQGMSPSKMWAIVIVALIHVLLGFAFVTGFANEFIKKASKDLDVFEVEEPPPPEEEPPPPEEVEPVAPEVVTPPAIVRTNQPPPPPMRTQTEQTQAPFNPDPPRAEPAPATPPQPPRVQCPGGVTVPAGTACPAPATPPSPPRLRSGTIGTDDYPASALRAEAQGTTRMSLQIGENGRVTACSVSGSSGNSSLDSTACSLAQRRFRYAPATRNGQPVAGSTSYSVVWRLPED